MPLIDTKSSVRNTLALGAVLTLLVACKPAEEAAPVDIRSVKVMTVGATDSKDLTVLSGTVQAQNQVNLAFRVDGRMVSRSVNVGDAVKAGQEIALLNPDNEQNGVNAAEANLEAARGLLIEARANERRNRYLLSQNFISQAAFDRITQQANSAQAQVNAAQANASIARNRLGYTRLTADAAGVVTAVGAEPGEVVQGGRMVVEVALQDGRDAIFNIPAQLKDVAPAAPKITISLATDPSVSVEGRVREVSPRADPATGSFRIRVGLIDPPAAMRLGTTVTGRMQIDAPKGFEIPSTALTRGDGAAAVWLVDKKTEQVSLRKVEVLHSGISNVIIGNGLAAGDIIVTAGVQALRPNQKVSLLRGDK
ncbi:efflux RND transporter periplasmic adaptor subunit [Deefgea rivuli]|uniref:efflux RND transporter periplasmic adaptor subunit n=1 Tax=Deefgea rivuli TaxID=400948 RepID=UPI000686156C|nr:efflux RND transporter periplasmic adaptor subunit [Deefgea rivuli]